MRLPSRSGRRCRWSKSQGADARRVAPAADSGVRPNDRCRGARARTLPAYRRGNFSGKVKSGNPICRIRRKVTLYRTKSLKLGSWTTTTAAGAWQITASGFAGISLGHFYAKVAKHSVRYRGTNYVCKAATSKTIPFTQ
jgi:hypothetical protein